MAGELTETGTLYSPLVGLMYVFNLIVGTGALTMPKAFASAGWLVSIIIVIALAFMSFLTVTFVVEAMAAANAMRRKNTRKVEGNVSPTLSQDDETQPLLSNVNTPGVVFSGSSDTCDEFEIAERIEMGQMASMFFNKVGVNLFYLTLVIYLYGDLAIYGAAMPKSLRDVVCTYNPNAGTNSSCAENMTDSSPCWGSSSLSRSDVYRLFVALFALLLGPFLFFNVQKTKYLQMFTTVMRWFAFTSMIVFAVIKLSKGEGEGHPPVGQVSGIPTLFGVCVYSFMCHHSLPSLVTPIRNKSSLLPLFATDYTLILAFYSVLSFTAIFSVSEVKDLYTLNFQPSTCDTGEHSLTSIAFFQYYLALFPVLILSTNFPIIGITLRNNLKTLILTEGKEYSFFVNRIVFPLLALIPPVAIAIGTNRVDILVGITGSYAGAVIQYVVPACLVYYARKDILSCMGPESINKHHSPFRHVAWVIFVLVWAFVCVVFVTINHIVTGI